MASPASNAAQFFSLSTIPQLSKSGQSQLDEERRKARQWVNLGKGIRWNPNTRETVTNPEYQAALEAERAHSMNMLNQRLDARTEKDRRPQNLGNGVIWDDQLQEYVIPEIYQEQQDRQNQARMERAQVMKPPPTGVTKKLAEWQTIVNQGEQIMQKIEKIPSVASPMRDMLTNAIREGVSPDLGNYVEGKLMPEDVRALKSEMKFLMMDLRHANFGSALTETEKALFTANDPAGNGVDFREAIRRMGVIVNLMRAKGEQLGSFYGMQPQQQAGAPMPAPAPTAPMQQQQPMQQQPMQQQQQPQPQQEMRTIGGKNYIRKGGQWYEVE